MRGTGHALRVRALVPLGSAAQCVEQPNCRKGQSNSKGDQQNRVVHDDANNVTDPAGQGSKDGANVIQESGQSSSFRSQNTFFLINFISMTHEGLDTFTEKTEQDYAKKIQHRFRSKKIRRSLEQRNREIDHSCHERIRPPNSLKIPDRNRAKRKAPAIQG